MPHTTSRRLLLSSLAASAAFPRSSGLDERKLEEAASLIRALTENGQVRSASLHVQQGKTVFARAFGKASDPDAIFLIASITKPMTAAGVMKLVERKQVRLEDPVSKYLPAFSEGDRKLATVGHLLTHSSGLPDQLPENVELRKRHAPLSEFVERTYKTPLLFKPGTKTSYQSMGVLLAAEIAERVTNQSFRGFLQKEIFAPLGMRRTALGLGRFTIADTERSQAELADAIYGGDGSAASWDWNSLYWRDLGAPWGGGHSTGPDIARFLRYFLHPTGRVVSKPLAELMTTDQNEGLNQPYAIGFAVDGKRFGGGCSPKTFGHGGSTGTLCWADPAKDLTFVILTTLPARVSNNLVIKPVSELVSGAA